MAWNDYRSSPPVGALIGNRADLAAGGTVSKRVTSENGEFPILVVESLGLIRAFVNACPHQDLPLDYRSPDIVSADGTMLLCSNHQAGFRIADGVGVMDLAIDCALEMIPIAIDSDGVIRIAPAD